MKSPSLSSILHLKCQVQEPSSPSQVLYELVLSIFVELCKCPLENLLFTFYTSDKNTFQFPMMYN